MNIPAAHNTQKPYLQLDVYHLSLLSALDLDCWYGGACIAFYAALLFRKTQTGMLYSLFSALIISFNLCNFYNCCEAF